MMRDGVWGDGSVMLHRMLFYAHCLFILSAPTKTDKRLVLMQEYNPKPCPPYDQQTDIANKQRKD